MTQRQLNLNERIEKDNITKIRHLAEDNKPLEERLKDGKPLVKGLDELFYFFSNDKQQEKSRFVVPQLRDDYEERLVDYKELTDELDLASTFERRRLESERNLDFDNAQGYKIKGMKDGFPGGHLQANILQSNLRRYRNRSLLTLGLYGLGSVTMLTGLSLWGDQGPWSELLLVGGGSSLGVGGLVEVDNYAGYENAKKQYKGMRMKLGRADRFIQDYREELNQ